MATEMKKAEMKQLLLQQKDHIANLLDRLDSEKSMYSKLFSEKYDMTKELAQVKEERDKALAEVLSDNALERLQDEAFKAGRAKGYEDAEAEFRPYEKQRELDALREDYENYVETHDVTTDDYETIREELAEIKENRFPCDVYWSADNGDITLYKIPNEIGCLNNDEGDNAVLHAFQNLYFGEEWGSYSSLSVVEMTREMLEEHVGELVEREEEPADISTPITSALANKMIRAHLEPESESEEEPTPKSTKDLVIDQLNEEPHAPAFEPIPEGHTQIVVGSYCVEFTWKVPAGINLNDEETYEFWDRWGCLRIRNKITDERWDIEEKDETDDFKEAHDLELHLEDEDGCRV